MGLCQSVFVDDEDKIIQKLQAKRQAKELAYFRQQLKKQKEECAFSQLDLSGKGTSRIKSPE